jgi:hypothetical protein
MTTLTIDSRPFLAHFCTRQPLLSGGGKDLLRQIPFQRWEGLSGRRISTMAKVAAIDNGNDAVKGAMLDAHQPLMRTVRIITAYAPAVTLRAGEGVTTWQVNDSESFRIGEDAVFTRHSESLPVGFTEERLSDGRSLRLLFASIVELLREAGYETASIEFQGEHDLYISLGIPNEEVTRQGPTDTVRRALSSLFNTLVRVRRTDESGRVTTWALRLVDITPYPQSFASFVTWYYALDGSPIQTDIVKHVTLDLGGGQLHSCEVELHHQGTGRPKLRMSASLLGDGTIAMARAARETIRARYPGVHLSDAEAQQVLVQGMVTVGGRRTRVDEIVAEVITARSHNVFTQLLPLLQEGQSFVMFTGGGSVLLAESLHRLVSSKRSPASFLFVPTEVAPVLNALGGYILAQTAAQRLLERSENTPPRPR